MLKQYENDWDVKETLKIMELNTKWLFKYESLDFKIDYPAEISQEKFLNYLDIAYKKFWFEVYQDVIKKYKGTEAP